MTGGRKKRWGWKRQLSAALALMVLLNGLTVGELRVQAEEPEQIMEETAREEKTVQPEESSAAPKDSSDAPEGSPTVPEEPSVTPEEPPAVSEGTPDQSEEIPAVSEGTPDQSEEIPVKPEETPDQSEETPVKPEGTPDQSEETPVKPEGTPDQSEETPVKPEEIPDKSEEDPDVSEKSPVAPEENQVQPEASPEQKLPAPVQLEQKADQPKGEEGIVLDKSDGDTHRIFSQEWVKGFTFETDVMLLEDGFSAALSFGIRDKGDIPAKWTGANVNFEDKNMRVFQVEGGAQDIGQASIEGTLDAKKPIHLKLEVTEGGDVTYEAWQTDAPDQKLTVTGRLKDYEGGYAGLLTFESRAKFTNTVLTPVQTSDEGEEKGLTDFRNIGDAVMEIDEASGRIRLAKNAGDHFVMYDGLEEPAEAFLLEADVRFTGDNMNGKNSAGLVFGAAEKDRVPSRWYGANVDTGRSADRDLFRVFGPELGDVWEGDGDRSRIDLTQPLHLKLEMEKSGAFTYTFGNAGGESCRISGTVPGWTGGYVGLLTFDSEAVFSRVVFENRTDEEVVPDAYRTNLQELAYHGGDWKITEEGLYSDAEGKGDCFALSETAGKNFVYSADVTFESGEGAAALVFRSDGDLANKECYAVNIDVGSHKCKFWRWQADEALQLIDEKEVPAAENETYTLKVVAADSWILYYVNDRLVASTGDYTLQPGNLGQSTVRREGVFGLLNWNSKVTFQNTYYKELDETFDPLLADLYVTAEAGTAERRPQFISTEPITIQYVRNDVSAVKVQAEGRSADAKVTVTDEKGNTYGAGDAIPVETGINLLTVTSTVRTQEEGQETEASAVYRINVHRLKPDEVYYNEPYRGQYHYSVKEGWANDPNGMVYYKGKYHLFYQFYDDRAWGPMHWAHAVSTDLLHWEDQPIALYPDANGAMYSGCIVADENNTSGLFSGGEGGLVALITADGNGQRIKLAYSEDEGMSWTKVDEIAADWTADPLKDGAFRDPKVFRWENKWFMVVAGGPLRIYSSDNLRSWKCEAAYKDLHTECPDLYPVETEDGQIKWVLSRGGRYYKVGDFRQQDGNWQFIPDAYYASQDGIMNFGHDSYAAMTYYLHDFGTAENPSIPEIIECNWMNTWNDYCNQVAVKNGSDFNGTFNLQLKTGLVLEDGRYMLTQTPVEAYETLRAKEQKMEYKGVTVGENNTLLQDFAGDTYEIVSRFYPKEGTRKVGFRLRTGEGEETLVVYDLENEQISIDRSRSGIIISGEFAKVYGQHVSRNTDGSVDLHVYVDKSSVEVFTKGYTAAGADQIFPSPSSVGASVLVEGTEAGADIVIYPLKSIWKDKAEVTVPQAVGSAMARTQRLYVGDERKLKAYVLPISVSQELTWSVTSGTDVVSVGEDGTVTGKSAGTAVVTAASKADPSLTLEFTIEVKENHFKTNIPEYVIQNGDWIIEDETLFDENTMANDFYMSAEPVEGDCSIEVDLSFEKGLINLFMASASTNPFDRGGAYALQFSDSRRVRLFRFGVDGDIAFGELPGPVNDGAFHHIKVVRTDRALQVYADYAEEACLTYTFDAADGYFSDGHVGVGLWDGALKVQNLYVYVDTKVLEEALEKAGNPAEEDYTPESFRAYQEALDQVQRLLESGSSSRKEVDAAAEALEYAQKNLVKKDENTGTPGDGEEKPGENNPGDAEEKPGENNPGDTEEKPGENNPGDTEGKPGQNNPGDTEGKPGQDNPGDTEGKPGQDNPGDTEGKPGQNNPGDTQEKPGQNTSGDKEQKPGKGSSGKRKGSSGKTERSAEVPAPAPGTAPAEQGRLQTVFGSSVSGNVPGTEKTEPETAANTGEGAEQVQPSEGEVIIQEEKSETFVDSKNEEVPLTAGVGSQKDAGGYAALTILGLLLAAGSFFLILAARKKKQHEK